MSHEPSLSHTHLQRLPVLAVDQRGVGPVRVRVSGEAALRARPEAVDRRRVGDDVLHRARVQARVVLIAKAVLRAVGGDLYRSTGDIEDNFKSIEDIFMSQINNFALSGPSCFNDMDMLVCGMNNRGNVSAGGCTFEEYKTHFCLWCMAQSPLMIGCDVRDIDDDILALLKNPDLIAINQDPEVRPIIPVNMFREERFPAYAKHLENGEYAFSLTNLEDETREIFLILADMGLPLDGHWGFKLRDCITGEDIDRVAEDIIKAEVKAHSTRVFRGKLVRVR